MFRLDKAEKQLFAFANKFSTTKYFNMFFIIIFLINTKRMQQ